MARHSPGDEETSPWAAHDGRRATRRRLFARRRTENRGVRVLGRLTSKGSCCHDDAVALGSDPRCSRLYCRGNGGEQRMNSLGASRAPPGVDSAPAGRRLAPADSADIGEGHRCRRLRPFAGDVHLPFIPFGAVLQAVGRHLWQRFARSERTHENVPSNLIGGHQMTRRPRRLRLVQQLVSPLRGRVPTRVARNVAREVRAQPRWPIARWLAQRRRPVEQAPGRSS